MKAARSRMAATEALASSERICARFLELSFVHQAKLFLVYVSVGNEVATEALIRHLLRDGKRVAIPKVLDATSMEAHEIREWGEWRSSVFGVPAPLAGRPLSSEVDICVVPGLAFSRRCDRLGFGCGHWDRFFEHHPVNRVIGFCHDWQIVDSFPTEATDRPADLVITEARILSRESPSVSPVPVLSTPLP